MIVGCEEAMRLLTELLTSDVHVLDKEQDVLQCVLCGYHHRLFDASPAVMQKQHHVECLIVRAKLALARWKKEQQA